MKRYLLMVIVCLLASLAGTRSADAATIRCESKDGKYRACSVDTRNGVRLSRQLSSQGCWQNDTWGYDRNRIWVDRGCRAEFQVGSAGHSSNNNDAVAAAVIIGLVGAAVIANQHDDRHDNHGNNGYPQRTFRCESKDNRFRYCNLPYRGHVEVYRQLSSNQCVYGRTWGLERSRIWVSHGCRAEFAVY
jgi:hypothetical protein